MSMTSAQSRFVVTRRTALASAAGLAIGRALPARAGGAETIRLGVSAPLTAQFAQNGLWMKNGVALAVKDINDRGGIKGRRIEVNFADDQGPNPTAAANAVSRLIAEDQSVVMIGPHFTPAILPNLPLLAQYSVPTLTGASGPVVTQQGSKWVFRIRLNDAVGAKLLVKYCVETLGWKKIGLEYVNTAFGQSGIAMVKEALTARSITPAPVQTHTDATKDFTPHLLAFGEAGVDGVIVWTDDQPAGLFAKQRTTLGSKFGLAGSTSFSQPTFLALAGDAAEGIVSITDFSKENPSPAIQAWKQKYKAAYNAEPELYATTYYDAVNIIAAAIERAPDASGPAIQDALTRTKDFAGAMTTYTWSENGDMVHSGLITKIEGGSVKVAAVVGV
jgi:branched-chain amino acid transport system substrate-binding protein